MNTVRSADGTSITFETTGRGPSLILVGGAFCDRHARASGTPLASLLAPHFTVFSYDRRGRGDSGDTPPYTLERELDDLAALITEAGGHANVYGISSGGLLALHAALHGLPIEKLVIYEAPFVLDPDRRPRQNLADELAELSRQGRRAEAAEVFLTRVVGVPPPAVAGMKRAPMWRGLEALAPTLSHDVRLTANAPALLERLPALALPTLVLDGDASPPWMREGSRAAAMAMPRGRYDSLAGQTHDVDPGSIAQAITNFLLT